jgi:hypothetical protein
MLYQRGSLDRNLASRAGVPARFVAAGAMSSVRDERHDRMDKKNDHSCKYSQREGFIDTRAANDCYAFHSFPHPDASASPDVLLRCAASVNEALRASTTGCAAAPAAWPMLVAMRRASISIAATVPAPASAAGWST